MSDKLYKKALFKKKPPTQEGNPLYYLFRNGRRGR